MCKVPEAGGSRGGSWDAEKRVRVAEGEATQANEAPVSHVQEPASHPKRNGGPWEGLEQ